MNDLHRTIGPQGLVEALARATPMAPPPALEGWDDPTPFHAFDVPPFPTSVLPPWLADFVRAEAIATQTPPDLAGLLVLAVAATALAKKAIVIVRQGWIEPVNLYVLVAMPPGSRKSVVFGDCFAPVEAYERDEVARAAPALAEASARKKAAAGAVKRLEQRLAKCDTPDERRLLGEDLARAARDADAIEVPSSPRLVVDDVTPEALAQVLAEQGGRLAVLSPEGDLFEQLAGRYSNGVPNLGAVLKAHAGDNLRVDRIGRPPAFVARPALTIGLAVQPDVLASLDRRKGFRGRGLLGRFLYALPVSLLGARSVTAPPVPDDVIGRYEENSLRLLNLPFGGDPAGERAPWPIRLAPEADQVLTAFSRWLEPQLGEGGELGSISDWAGKLAGAVARIAGLFHAAEWSAPWEVRVTRDTMERAAELGRYLLGHAKAVFGLMGADQRVTLCERVLAWIKRTGKSEFTRREVFQSLKGSTNTIQTLEQLEEPLATLTRHGFVRPFTRRPAGRGRPAPAYQVNPKWNCGGSGGAGLCAHGSRSATTGVDS